MPVSLGMTSTLQHSRKATWATSWRTRPKALLLCARFQCAPHIIMLNSRNSAHRSLSCPYINWVSVRQKHVSATQCGDGLEDRVFLEIAPCSGALCPLPRPRPPITKERVQYRIPCLSASFARVSECFLTGTFFCLTGLPLV
jgi:hypothetical protein